MHEIKRCSWPQKSELVENTAIVLIVTALITLFVYVVDLFSRESLMWFLEKVPELLAGK